MTMFTPFLRRALAQPTHLSLRNSSTPLTRTIRPFSHRSALLAAKDAQDKDSLKPESNEYSKSGSDTAAAELDDTAFNPNKTSPEEEYASAGRESQEASNPLDGSPANQEISNTGSQESGGHSGSPSASKGETSDRERTSGKGSASKGSSGKRYQ